MTTDFFLIIFLLFLLLKLRNIIVFYSSLSSFLKVTDSKSNLLTFYRAVIFRLGRILEGGEKGPGIFFM